MILSQRVMNSGWVSSAGFIIRARGFFRLWVKMKYPVGWQYCRRGPQIGPELLFWVMTRKENMREEASDLAICKSVLIIRTGTASMGRFPTVFFRAVGAEFARAGG